MARSRSLSNRWRFINPAYYLKRPKRLALLFIGFVFVSFFVWDRQTLVREHEALVDAPDMVRCQMNFKRLTLTDIIIDIKRTPKKKILIEATEAADVKNKWENSSWGKKLIVQKRRAALTDFDRFKLMLAKIKKASLVRQELVKLKKETTA